MNTVPADPLVRIAELPGVAEAVRESRAAVDRLLGHRVLRTRGSEVSAEAALRGARASAALAGATVSLERLRAGESTDPRVLGALRVSGELGRLVDAWSKAPGQVLARLHTLAAADAVTAERLGRPRREGEWGEWKGEEEAPPGERGVDAPVPAADEVGARLAALGELLTARTAAPALVVGAVVHGELQALRPFVWGNGLVARAAERLTLIERGFDPKSLTPVEVGHERLAANYREALAGYASGTPSGVAAWVVHCAGAASAGARESLATCEALRRG